MTFYSYKGKRIKARDQHLLYHLTMAAMIPLFTIVMILLHIKSLISANWTTFAWIVLVNQLKTVSFWGSVFTSLLVCLIVVLFYCYYRVDSLKQLKHRQKLARMILQNGWYELSEMKQEGFFKDLQSNKTKIKISHFPKVYYLMKDGLIHIHVEITMGKYQDQLLRLENKLESGLYCELVEKNLKESYVEYVLLYDTIGSRIEVQDVIAENGALKLMESLWWEYDKLPHLLLAGGTGSGKSYFILTLIEALLRTNANLYILDPKNSDLADLSAVMDHVYYRKDEMLQCVDFFYHDMLTRSEKMKQHPNYRTGGNYADLGLPANFLIFDEYVAMMDMLGRESVGVISKLKQIIMLGRQAGFFLIMACQRPDAKYFGEGIRDNFNFRVALGRMSELGYGMMFGSDTQKQFFLKPIKGRGYVDNGTNMISEFYAPLVPKDHDFLAEIKQLIENKAHYMELANTVKDENKELATDKAKELD